MTIPKGTCKGITGASGSGKSTLLKCVMGVSEDIYKDISGKIRLNQEDLIQMSRRNKRHLCGQTIAYMPQNPQLAFNPRKTIGDQSHETLAFKLKLSKEKSMKVMKKELLKLDLQDWDRLLDAYPQSISGGMLQRVILALIMCMSPTYILADEPTSALDQKNKRLLIEALKNIKNDIGLIIVSHDSSLLFEICDEVYVMENGQIIEKGPMEQLINYPVKKWTKNFAMLHQKSEERQYLWQTL